MELCSVDNCNKPIKAKQLCSMHHQRLLRHGDPMIVRPRKERKIENCKWVCCKNTAETKGYCSKHYYIQRVMAKNKGIMT
ncbi:hypothetical protein [Paenibacillus sp. NEAU-GSW1]|uniref:hypothetical protein n=1 Tax=Paenibacillus sp. NEAU-GSW1 TaxID=2682486 RepID=UPI0012E1BFC3|nr:hypothetical protein [Paenibacillus sp. NEAU-GSW1]MUT66703.1 hypothetical protein [Paenibacillus sp. NEAU-GSW1]